MDTGYLIVKIMNQWYTSYLMLKMTHFCGLIRFYHLKIVVFFPRFYSILTVSPHKVALTLFSDLSNKVMSLLDT